MADYERLRPVAVTSAPDATGKNPGNLTAEFASGSLPSVNSYEIYHMTVVSGPALAKANIVVAGQVWSYVVLDSNGGNEWDPSQPLLMHKDASLYFVWNIPSPGVAGKIPVVTVWPRYDVNLPANASALSALVP